MQDFWLHIVCKGNLKFLVHGIRPPTSLQTTAGQVVTATD